MKFSRDEILDKTLAYAESKGWQQTSVREISKEINYSTIKIYHEFGGKDGLMKELQVKGFRLLRDAYIKSLTLNAKPEEKMIELCKAHYRFARNNRRHYELMFQTGGAACQSVSGEVLQQTSEPVRELITAIAGKVTTTLFFNWWSVVHGFTVIMQNNYSLPEKETIALLESIVKNFIKGIKE